MSLNKLKAGIKTETISPKFTFAGLIFQTTKNSKRREEGGEELEKNLLTMGRWKNRWGTPDRCFLFGVSTFQITI